MLPPLALFALVPLAALALPAIARAADAELAVSQAAPATDSGGAVDGLYPLWEQTAALLPSGGFQIGWEHAQVALGRLQLGTQPILDLHGTLNLQAKTELWRTGRFRLALIVGGYHVPTAAESRTIGNLYASGFTNPYAAVWLIPISLAKSLRLGERVTLHWTSTLLVSQSSAAEHRYLTGGQTLMLEVAASPRWAARLHAGVEGWPIQTVAHAGLSFAYTGDHVYAAVGVARRFSFEGESSNVVMLDAGLLFR